MNQTAQKRDGHNMSQPSGDGYEKNNSNPRWMKVSSRGYPDDKSSILGFGIFGEINQPAIGSSNISGKSRFSMFFYRQEGEWVSGWEERTRVSVGILIRIHIDLIDDFLVWHIFF